MTVPALDQLVERLHASADRVAAGAGTPDMDRLAEAGAVFLQTSELADEYGSVVRMDPAGVGYGIMLGWLTRQGDPVLPTPDGPDGQDQRWRLGMNGWRIEVVSPDTRHCGRRGEVTGFSYPDNLYVVLDGNERPYRFKWPEVRPA